jgi:membrane protein YdbS with pleckstrin-like domain
VEVNGGAVYCHKCGERLDKHTFDTDASAQPSGEASGSAEPTATATETFRRAAQMRSAGAGDAEQELWAGSYSPKDMVGVWAVCGLVTLVLLALAIWLNMSYDIAPLFIWGGLLVVLLVLWGYPLVLLLYRRTSVRYRLTTQRFFHEKGILRHLTDRIEVIDMDDITFEQSILQRMFNVGTIHITSSDKTHPVLDVPGIENVRQVSALMDDARRRERMRRGLHIEAV